MLIVSNAGAGRGFIHERTVIVPGMTHPILNMKFADMDKDGVPELLASDSSTAVLYSISQNKTLFTKTVDSGYTIGSIELADVNRDSAIDVTFSSSIVLPISYPAFFANRIDVYDGASRFAHHDSELYIALADDWRSPFTAAVDINDDGVNELLFSYSTTGVTGPWLPLVYYNGGRTLLYRSFPESLSASSDLRTLSLRSMRLTPSGVIALSELWYGRWNDGGPVPLYNVRASSIASVDSSLISSGIATQGHEQRCLSEYHDDYRNRVDCFGRLYLGGEGDELLTTYSHVYRCPLENRYTIAESLSLWELTSPDSAQLIWSRDITGTSYHDFAFMPQLPGHFFAFTGDTLVMFNGTDGSIRKTLTDTPIGTKRWDTTFPDREPHLIATKGDTTDIYRLDIAVEAPESTVGHMLPGSLTLGSPYPNPFNAQMSIPVNISHRGQLDIVVYNLLGQAVATLFEGEVVSGEHRYIWDATGNASGLYFIRVSFEGKSLTAKALLLK